MDYCLGIEGFHTSYSAGVLARCDGTIVASCRLGAELQLHTVDPSLLVARIQQLVTTLFERARGRHTAEFASIPDAGALLRRAIACLGISGVTFKYDREVVLPGILKGAGWPNQAFLCTGDAEIAFVSHTRSMNGSMILAANGSTAYAVQQGIGERSRHRRHGGWGPAIGDEASGYHLGTKTLRAIGRQFDTDAPPSLLWEAVLGWLRNPVPRTTIAAKANARWTLLEEEIKAAEACDIDLRTVLFRFAHEAAWSGTSGAWRQVASRLAIPLMQAYRAKDPTAIELVEDALNDLDAQHKEVCRRFGAEDDVLQPVVFAGGLLTNNDDVRTGLEERIARRLKPESSPLKVVKSGDPGTMRPVMGALLFALGGSRPNALCLPSPALIARVYDEHVRPEFEGDLRYE
jgi:N-acetylglucosamine kinase-like BadF-type ATPase